MEWIITSRNFKYLGKDSDNVTFRREPSDRVYFGRYPYKIKLNFSAEVRAKVELDMSGYDPTKHPEHAITRLNTNDTELQDFWIARNIKWMETQRAWSTLARLGDTVRLVDVFQNMRLYTNGRKGTITAYIENKEHLETIIDAFENNVELVAGPWNLKHKKLLLDNNCSIAVRKKLFWNKFQIKVVARPQWGMGIQNRRDKIKQLSEFLVDTLEPKKVKFNSHHFVEICFWTNNAELDLIKPFLYMAHPNTHLHITRCFYNK